MIRYLLSSVPRLPDPDREPTPVVAPPEHDPDVEPALPDAPPTIGDPEPDRELQPA